MYISAAFYFLTVTISSLYFINAMQNYILQKTHVLDFVKLTLRGLDGSENSFLCEGFCCKCK